MVANDEPPSNLAAVLEGSLDVRDAGSGRLSRTASRPDDLQAARRTHELESEVAPADDEDDAK
jgi:hypothetical protein